MFGVNTPPQKKPAAERKKEREKKSRVNAPKEQKKSLLFEGRER
jgi:hypothetical protein